MRSVGTWSVRDSLGESLVWLIANSEVWHHRKIESHRLLDGPRSRRQVSIDLTVPNDERLLIRTDFTEEATQIVVPLALVKKATLQDFDASVDGASLLIADTALNGAAAVELLGAAIRLDLGRSVTATEEESLRSVVFAPGEEGASKAQAFIAEWQSRAPSEFASLSEVTLALLGTLERCFLLIGLMPLESAGKHVLIKYSEHWELAAAERARGFSTLGWLLASCGWRTAALQIDLNDAGLRPNSYHVEVHAPTGLLNERLSVERPPFEGNDGEILGDDSRHTSVSHVAVRGGELPRSAFVNLAISTHGLLARAAIAYVASFLLFLAGSSTTVAGAVFDPDARSATSLFLAVIAVLLGSLTREAENPVSSRFLLPLRMALIFLAALYFVSAAAVAVGVGFDGGAAILRIGLAMTAAGALLVAGGYVQCRRRQV